jgi:hypothetical protein
MKQTNVRTRLTVALMATALAASPLRADTEIEVPEGVTRPIAETPKRPGGLPWLGLVLSKGLPAYTGHSNRTPAGGPALEFGEVVYVLAEHKAPRRFLLAKFDGRTEKFQRLVGWCEADWILDDPQPLTVKRARAYLENAWRGYPEELLWVGRYLPAAKAGDPGENAPLKAVSHPTKGDFAFTFPVPPEDFVARKEAARPGDGVPIQRHGFFYVAKLIVRGKQAYVVLMTDSKLVLFDPGEDGAAHGLIGVVPAEMVVLAPTREFGVPEQKTAAYDARRDRDAPIRFFASLNQVSAWVRGEAKDRRGEPVAPVFKEPFLPKGRYPEAVGDGATGYLLLASPAVKTAGGPVRVFHLAVPTRRGGGEIADAELNKDRDRLLKATLQMRTVEVVFCIDATGSMGPVYPRVLEATEKYVSTLLSEEGKRPDLDQIRLKVGVVLYRDYCDGPNLVEHSGGFYDVSTVKGFAGFADFLRDAGRRCAGGGDRLEQPFQGIDVAIREFFRNGTRHTPGAAPVIVLFGDAGNHVKGRPDCEPATELDLETIRERLAGKGGANQQTSVMLNSVYTHLPHGEPCPEWAAQMPVLATASGGLATEVHLTGAAAARVPDELARHLAKILDARRARARRERLGIASLFAGGNPVLTIEGEDGVRRLEEIIPTHDLKGMRERLGKTVFAFLYTPESEPGDTLPRWQLRVLLTKSEVSRLATVCRELEGQLKTALATATLEGGSAAYRMLVIRSLVMVLGERDLTPEERRKWKDAAIEEVEREVSQLPVRFACLAKLKKSLGRGDVQDLRKQLAERAALLERLNAERTPVPSGVATGELHLAVRSDELP